MKTGVLDDQTYNVRWNCFDNYESITARTSLKCSL